MTTVETPLVEDVAANFFPTRTFSRQEVDASPFDEGEWNKRTVTISDDTGRPVFTQEDVEAPAAWSDMAVKVVASKYFYGQQGTLQRERSVKQLIHRVVKTIATWGLEDGIFSSSKEMDTFYDELCWLCINQHAAFNSPVWFNVGLWQEYGVGGNSIGNWAIDKKTKVPSLAKTQFERPQASACFICRVEDTMESIMALATTEAMLFKYGSGSGADLTSIRSTRETMTGGGRPSGPLSFLRIYDQVGGVVKSGGRTRRSAKINTLFAHHGDIEEFIEAKMREEKKAWALIDAGYDGSFNGEVYRETIAFQNENLSVRATDAFMRAATIGSGDWWTKSKKDVPLEKKDARKLLDKIAEGTWVCGDPGLQFHDTINRWNTCSGTEPQVSTNPCCFVGDTYVDTSEGMIKMSALQQMSASGESLPQAVTWDMVNKCPMLRPILKAWVAGVSRELVTVKTDKGITVKCTPEHRFLTFDGLWVEAQHLVSGQRLRKIWRDLYKKDDDGDEFKMEKMTCEANDRVASVENEALSEGVQVFDMEVEDTHNFSVRDEGYGHSLVVHNSEYSFLNNTSCNLASLNLVKFLDGSTFDTARFEAAVRILITAQEILVDNCSYPTADIATNSHIFRTLGLGHANIGALLMRLGLPYGSDEGRAMAASITALMTGCAYSQSADMARLMGPFPGYNDARAANVPHPIEEDNVESTRRVVSMHRDGVEKIGSYPLLNSNILEAATRSWAMAQSVGRKHGYRNAQLTVLAPTGTISFMMDCDTTGVEPDIALVKYKLLAGGGTLKIVNRSVPAALARLGYSSNAVGQIITHIDTYDTVEDQPGAASGLKAEHLPVFDCAFKARLGRRSIHYRDHLLMMAATQPFISGGISKTINFPTEATPSDIRDAYVEAWKLGLKCVAIYRDGSKRSQPLNMSKGGLSGGNVLDTKVQALQQELEEKKREIVELWERVEDLGMPVRQRLPETRQAVTHKFEISGHEGYLTVGLFDNGGPGELFITMSKDGSTIGGLMDCIGTLTSMALQYGVPLDTLVNKFSFVRFEPSGVTRNPEIRIANSVIDYVFRWMGHRFNQPAQPIQPAPQVPVMVTLQRSVTAAMMVGDLAQSLNDSLSHLQKDAPPCSNCGTITVRNGACYKCMNCGESMGCS